MGESLDGIVVKVYVGEPKVGRSGQVIAVASEDCEAMILGGDLDDIPIEIVHRVIRTVMPERQLERRGSECPSNELVSEADAEDRNVFVGQP